MSLSFLYSIFCLYVYLCAFFRWTNITSVIESQKAMQTKWKELRENKTNKEITLAVTFEKFARTINALNRCWTHKNQPCLLHLYDLLICLTCGSVNFEYTIFCWSIVCFVRSFLFACISFLSSFYFYSIKMPDINWFNSKSFHAEKWNEIPRNTEKCQFRLISVFI